MSQRLILPFRGKTLVNAAYKLPVYQRKFGFPHYGIDLGCKESRTVYGLGRGRVIAAGLDGADTSQRMGYAVVIVYEDVILAKGQKTAGDQQVRAGEVRPLACRMFHFDSLAVKAGDEVDTGTVIGVYGATGKYVSGPHLHLELDLDADAPQYAYGIASSGRVIKKGSVDSTLDPSFVWFLGEGQSAAEGGPGWLAQGWLLQNDLDIPRLPQGAQGPNWEALYRQEQARAQAAEDRLTLLRQELAALAQKYSA